MTSSLGNINKPSGCAVFDSFLKHLFTLKTNHDASGFYDVKGTWRVVYLKKYKTFAYHLYIAAQEQKSVETKN